MPSLINVLMPVTPAGVTIPTTAEAVVATISGINVDARESVVVMDVSMSVTVGAGGTAATVFFRRGDTVTGEVIDETGPVNVTAGDLVRLGLTTYDQPGEMVDGSYSATVQITGATANSTINGCCMRAQVQTAG